MSSKQDRIFQATPEPGQNPANQKKPRTAWIAAPIRAIVQALRNVTLLAAFLMFAWGMCEGFLPEELRLTTFIGRRIVNLGNIENTGTAKTAAQKAEAVAASQGAVQLIQNCETQRNNTGQQAFATCMANPRSLITGCEFQRDQVLQAMSCDHYTAQQLSPTTYNNLP